MFRFWPLSKINGTLGKFVKIAGWEILKMCLKVSGNLTGGRSREGGGIFRRCVGISGNRIYTVHVHLQYMDGTCAKCLGECTVR
jgi:hypothetical protein